MTKRLFEYFTEGKTLQFKEEIRSRLYKIAEEKLEERKMKLCEKYAKGTDEYDDGGSDDTNGHSEDLQILKQGDPKTDNIVNKILAKQRANIDAMKKRVSVQKGQNTKLINQSSKTREKIERTHPAAAYGGKRFSELLSKMDFSKYNLKKKVKRNPKESIEEELELVLDEARKKRSNVQKMGRLKLVRARIRKGKLQRRKKVSGVKGFALRGGKLKRMTASERRKRKMGARKAKFKRKAKAARIKIALRRSLRKRKAMGL